VNFPLRAGTSRINPKGTALFLCRATELSQHRSVTEHVCWSHSNEDPMGLPHLYSSKLFLLRTLSGACRSSCLALGGKHIHVIALHVEYMVALCYARKCMVNRKVTTQSHLLVRQR
jgi:hypothetical protein